MAFFRAIFVVCFCVSFCVQAFAGVGDYDKRQKADWTSDKFSKYVSIGGKDFSQCTGQYVAPNLILTAAHCYQGQQVGVIDDVYNPVINKNDSFKAKLVKLGNYRSGDSGSRKQDYAILLVQDKNNYYTKGAFDIGVLDATQEYESIINAGFGWVRILSNEEVDFLRNILNNELKTVKYMSFSSVEETINEALKEKNMKPLRDDNLNLKYSNCNILIDVDCYYVCKEYLWYEDGSKSKNSQYNPEKCKTVCENKENIKKKAEYPDVLGTTCDSWGGNSGGASFSAKTGKLVSICSAGIDAFGNAEDVNVVVSSFALRDVVEQMKKEYPVQLNAPRKQEHIEYMPGTSVNDIFKSIELGKITKSDISVPGIPNNSESETSETTVNAVETNNTEKTNNKQGDITKTANDIKEGVYVASGSAVSNNPEPKAPETNVNTVVSVDPTPNINIIKENIENVVNDGDISVRDILFIVDGMTTIQKLEEEYAKAKERENSLENRMLVAATIGATGFGGMELASGIAEQSADADAAADMAAYTQKMQCRVGGWRYNFNEKSVNVGGENVLTGLYNEYVALADDMARRRTELEQSPGIESAVVFKREYTGLYDDVGSGVQNGTYVSLYRASVGNPNDISRIADDATNTQNRIDTGLGVVGIGVAGGVGGNLIINRPNKQ